MHSTRFKVTRKVSIVSAIVNTILAISKIVIGITGQSQALVADGLHSVSDIFSDGIVLFAAKASQQQPDEQHPYGHQRIETITVIIIATILLAIGLAILWPAAINIIRHQDHTTKPDITTLITAISSIIANEILFQYSYYKGKAIQSSLLISNAWHNRSDALVSLIVVASIIGNRLGIQQLDSVGAAIVAIIIIYVSSKMIWTSFNELIDAAVDTNTLNDIYKIISKTKGVVSVHNLRTRTHAQHIFIDAHVEVAPTISVSEGHHIADTAEQRLRLGNSNITDVAIHIDPEDDTHHYAYPLHLNREDLTPTIENIITTIEPNALIHKIILHYLQHKLNLEVILVLPSDITCHHQIAQQVAQKAKEIEGINNCQVYFKTNMEDKE